MKFSDLFSCAYLKPLVSFQTTFYCFWRLLLDHNKQSCLINLFGNYLTFLLITKYYLSLKISSFKVFKIRLNKNPNKGLPKSLGTILLVFILGKLPEVMEQSLGTLLSHPFYNSRSIFYSLSRKQINKYHSSEPEMFN